MSDLASLQELATLLSGHVDGDRVLCPGPGHSADDRSLSVWPAKNDNGFEVHSFSPKDIHEACVAHVKARLDPKQRAALAALGATLPARDRTDARESDPLAPGWYSRRSLAPKAESPAAAKHRMRIERVRAIWNEAVSPLRTPVASYLWNRGLDLPSDVAGEVIRYHPRCPWKDELTNKTFYTHAMVAAMRDIRTDEIVAVQRTRLDLVEREGVLVGVKRERRMLGPAAGTAIKLDADDTVLGGLHVSEGLETAVTARQLGLRPTWALGSAGAIAAFPVLPGIECLTILAEHDDANAKATHACAARWHAAGREVLINRPIGGKDLNDAWRGIA